MFRYSSVSTAMIDERRARVCGWLRQAAPHASVPPADVVQTARNDGVWLLLADRLPFGQFADERRQAAVIEAIRARELQAVLSTLHEAGVRPVLLKGAALAYTHYPRPELRPRSDTDVIVPFEARDTVASALLAAGYSRPREVDGDVAVGQFHFVRTDQYGCEHALDVHWRVSNVRAFADALTFEELRRDAVAVPQLGPYAQGASPVHALFFACMHRVAHHGDSPNLLWLYDVHLLASRLTSIERDAFVALAIERRMRGVCARSLALADEAFGGIEKRWREALGATDGVHEPAAAFVGGGLRPIDILKSDLASTAGRSRARLLREHLFPSPSYMRQRFPNWPVALLPLAYACRIVVGAPRWLRR